MVTIKAKLSIKWPINIEIDAFGFSFKLSSTVKTLKKMAENFV